MKKTTYNAFRLSKMLVLTAAISLTTVSCDDGDGSPRIKDGKVSTYYESTQGVITEVEEIEPGDDYKIIDERLIDNKEESIAIVHTLEGTVDTLSLRKMKSDPEYNRGHRGLRSVLFYGLAASYLGRNMSGVKPDASKYKTPGAYNKSAGLKDNLSSSARSRRVTVPGAKSSGYGSGKSFRSRSFGG